MKTTDAHEGNGGTLKTVCKIFPDRILLTRSTTIEVGEENIEIKSESTIAHKIEGDLQKIVKHIAGQRLSAKSFPPNYQSDTSYSAFLYNDTDTPEIVTLIEKMGALVLETRATPAAGKLTTLIDSLCDGK